MQIKTINVRRFVHQLLAFNGTHITNKRSKLMANIVSIEALTDKYCKYGVNLPIRKNYIYNTVYLDCRKFDIFNYNFGKR